ncbi:vesicle-fusing ATPase [Phyllosticta citribraziliensis]|uniref:Vesicular-fusion protein SEC18 n=1 Tax=Phyllosticta citribraziliensis TaxID=989973 RepID=A0ABR1LCT9_9PEZI
MFNRGGPFGSRPQGSPQQGGYNPVGQQPPPPGYGDPRMRASGLPARPSQQMPPPMPEKHSAPYARSSQGPGGSKSLQPVKNAFGDLLIWGNIAAVSTQDFPPGGPHTIILNDHYVLPAQPVQECPPGQIGLNEAQRSWAQISISPGAFVTARIFEGTNDFLSTIDISAVFASAKQAVQSTFDQEQFSAYFMKTFGGQILAPGQQLLMSFQSIRFRLQIQSVKLGNVTDMSQGEQNDDERTDPNARGILHKGTQAFFQSEADSPVAVKFSYPKGKKLQANQLLKSGFKFEDLKIGGLDTEFKAIFRRAFASRLFGDDLVEKLGIQHVKGILLHGPPGTGKTLIAREIGKMLRIDEDHVQIVNGPEVLNKFVGQSEENIRKLFAKAEQDKNELNLIIFDELDAVCKQRGSGAGGGTGVGDSVVNQLLSKLDGVNQMNNIILIGMTNRMDMIDEALLRPGRLEVHMEISLPDEKGRVQIINIHTKNMRDNDVLASDVNIEELAQLTKNFSGAEITGLVKAATSYAFSRHMKLGDKPTISEDVSEMKVRREDFLNALEEVQPLFGVAEEELEKRIQGGIIHYSSIINTILEDGKLYVNQVGKGNTPVLSVALHGPPGSGKTALASQIALSSEFSFIKLISPEDMIGYSEMQKVQQLDKTFRDAYKSKLSVILIDNIELLVDWVPIGPRFSNTVLVALKVLLGKQPPKDRRLLILATTTERSVLQQLDLFDRFDFDIPVPNVQSRKELQLVLNESASFGPEQVHDIISDVPDQIGVGIKKILTGIETARQDPRDVTGRYKRFLETSIAANKFL